jgi:hypothetical protein
MGDRAPWLSVLEVLAKVAAAAGLFAYLLSRGGVRPIAATAVTLAHLLALSCVMPISPEAVFVTAITLGTCSYAVLAVDRPWLRAGIVAGCFITLGLILAQASVRLFVIGVTPLALWTGFMVMIRDWARISPDIERPSANSATDEP